MLGLAWPMIMLNLAQTAMQTTDVMMMGRLGSAALASGTLGANLYFSPMIFGLGIILAVSPMVAVELSRNRHSGATSGARSARASGCRARLPADLAVPVERRGRARRHGAGPRPVGRRRAYLRAMQWATLPYYLYIVLRSFISALERPGWALAIAALAVAFNALANWCLMFGNWGFPALGIVGSGIATTLSSSLMFAGLATVVLVDRKFRRYRLFGRFWRADWPTGFASFSPSACPSPASTPSRSPSSTPRRC